MSATSRGIATAIHARGNVYLRICRRIERTQGYSKKNPEQRWGLRERVFFACGASHILAYAFLERYEMPDAKVVWIKPRPGLWGNHIFVAFDGWAFDYHGYSHQMRFSITLGSVRGILAGMGCDACRVTGGGSHL